MTPARRDIDLQRTYDAKRLADDELLWARIRAVVDARAARDAELTGAASAWRQSLVDLAAVAEIIAAELEAPVS